VSPDQNPASARTVPTATMSQRMRSADRLANALVNAATHGWRVDLSDHDADLNIEPILHPILDQAPRVAAGIDPHAVRLARSAGNGRGGCRSKGWIDRVRRRAVPLLIMGRSRSSSYIIGPAASSENGQECIRGVGGGGSRVPLGWGW
jgi:hypothetical protein